MVIRGMVYYCYTNINYGQTVNPVQNAPTSKIIGLCYVSSNSGVEGHWRMATRVQITIYVSSTFRWGCWVGDPYTLLIFKTSNILQALQVNDLVNLGRWTLMIRTHYCFIGIFFYLDLVGGMVFSTSFDHLFDWFLSEFWCICVVSRLHVWWFMIYHDHIWQLYMRANLPKNPAGTETDFRISTSLHLPNIQW